MNNSIEIFGLPGCGKTRIASEFVQNESTSNLEEMESAYREALCDIHHIPKTDIIRNQIPDRALEYLSSCSGWRAHAVQSFQMLNPDSNAVITKAIQDYSTDPARQQWAAQSLLSLQEKYWTVTTEYNSNWILIDEGFIDRTKSLFCPPKPSKELDRSDVSDYLETVSHPDILVLVDVDVDLALDRMRARDTGAPNQFSDLSEDELRSVLLRMKSCISLIESEFRSNEWKIITVDNCGSVEESVSELQDELNSKTEVGFSVA